MLFRIIYSVKYYLKNFLSHEILVIKTNQTCINNNLKVMFQNEFEVVTRSIDYENDEAVTNDIETSICSSGSGRH